MKMPTFSPKGGRWSQRAPRAPEPAGINDPHATYHYLCSKTTSAWKTKDSKNSFRGKWLELFYTQQSQTHTHINIPHKRISFQTDKKQGCFKTTPQESAALGDERLIVYNLKPPTPKLVWTLQRKHFPHIPEQPSSDSIRPHSKQVVPNSIWAKCASSSPHMVALTPYSF